MTSLPEDTIVPILEEHYTYAIVLGVSLFGVAWGLVNTLLVSRCNL